ncbi:MAG: transketolase, partial [Candidatus Lokiarchaeota archaeon]|nr:transketolase [Candidatus Lokiarchaeota archaeon]
MRNSFIHALEEYSQPNTILIVGDLGFGVVENFKKKYPNQYINAGVAEQNMTGLAAGLALGGKKVFTYSIANFTILRPLEQIRNDIAYHDLNVTMVSVGGGLAYGSLGFSHHATEDLAIMRALPGMTVLAPGDTVEAFEITKRIIQDDLGPAYLRLGRAGEATLHSDESIQSLKIGKVLPLVTNGDSTLAILSTGGMLETAVNVRSQLLEDEIESSIFSF